MKRIALLTVLVISACPCRRAFQPPADSVLLPIPDRQWEAGAPDEGWCGESSIQMVALHYGAWVPQPVINALGRSTHVDLWEEDVPVAMDKLGLGYERAQVEDREAFVSWIIDQLRRGRPVIVGAKLMPSDHPEWDVDHLMPVVGFSPRGLVFDTNMDPGQTEVTWAALGGREGISFLSPTGKFYGYAVTGFGAGPPVTLRERKPGTFEVRVSGLDGGAWALRRDDLDGGITLGPLVEELSLSPTESARFSVIPR